MGVKLQQLVPEAEVVGVLVRLANIGTVVPLELVAQVLHHPSVTVWMMWCTQREAMVVFAPALAVGMRATRTPTRATAAQVPVVLDQAQRAATAAAGSW